MASAGLRLILLSYSPVLGNPRIAQESRVPAAVTSKRVPRTTIMGSLNMNSMAEENDGKGLEGELRPCPCCGLPITTGLFESQRLVNTPVALEALSLSDQADEIETRQGGALTVNGRSFLPANISLPLFRHESPVGAVVWVETAYHVGDDLLRFVEQKLAHFSASASLACDIPGFPGTIGALVTIEAWQGEDIPRITWCSDMRVLMIGRSDDFGHNDLVRLYRRLWGGSGETPPDNPILREAAQKAVEQHSGRSYAKPVGAIGRYAGITPPQILVRPPLDTGGEARLATVGIAEGMKGPRKVELVTATKNGGHAFEKSFGEFCFWSRREQNPPLDNGIIIPENQGGIPEHPNMAAWLILENFETEEGPLCPPPSEAGQAVIDYLAAIPITREEFAFAHHFGVAELTTRLEDSGADVTDLGRESCVSL